MSENIQIAIRKRMEVYKGALVVDGKFLDTFEDDRLKDLVDDCLNHMYATDHPDGTSLLITIKVDLPDESGTKG